AVDRGRYRVILADAAGEFTAAALDPESKRQSDRHSTSVTAVSASNLRRRAIVPGDVVKLVGDTSGRHGTLARLVEITKRRSLLARTPDDPDPTERVLVANVDVLGIVSATGGPVPSYGLIDSALVAAFDADIGPLLIVTTTDLHSAAEIRQRFSATGVVLIDSSLPPDSGRV